MNALPVQRLSLMLLGGLLGVASGCDREDEFLVTGTLLMDGQPAIGEIVIERLNQQDKPEDSVTVVSDDRGRFSADLGNVGKGVETVNCRIVIRVTPFSESGLPSVFDSTAAPEKRVELRRTLTRGQAPLTLALTQ